jgi:hypothetical protein
MGLIEVTDFSSEGWMDPVRALERAAWCCEQLENAEILWFPAPLLKNSGATGAF